MSNFYAAGKAALTSNNEEWETPQDLYDRLNAIYGFTLDPCATDENAKAPKHFTKEQDGLAQSWAGEVVFCNPPYGRNIGAWVKKCSEESRHATVVALIPARTDTSYFHEFIYKKARIEFLRGRLKFERGGAANERGTLPEHDYLLLRGELMELLPCPFCGVTPGKVYKPTSQTTQIICPNCRAQFPKSTNENAFDSAWNARMPFAIRYEQSVSACDWRTYEPCKFLADYCSYCGQGANCQAFCGAKVVE